MTIKVYFHNFWAGFENGKDPVSFIFFKLLFQKVYNTETNFLYFYFEKYKKLLLTLPTTFYIY